MIRTAQVEFPQSCKVYDFKTDLKLVVGDKVVCDTAQGLTVGEVIAVIDLTPKSAKWVVQKIDLDQHELRVATEAQLAVVKKKLDARKKLLEESAVYEILAREDSQIADLLAQYKELNKQLQ